MRKFCTFWFLSGLLVAALPVFGQTTPPATETTTTTLPPVGLASTETVQVNVVNASPALPTVSTTAAPPACSGSITFLDAGGSTIGTATEFKLSSGQIFSARLPYATAAASGTARIVVRAAISTTLNLSSAPNPVVNGTTVLPLLLPNCFLTSSLETYDTATGVTHVFYANSGPQAVPVLRSGQFTASLPAR